MNAITSLLSKWEARSLSAAPVDQMLINRHVRELREALAGEAPSLCESCATEGQCMNRSKLCRVMRGTVTIEHKKPDDTEGGAHD